MSAQQKQHADLIRHRELNALRRLMVGRHQPNASVRPTLSVTRSTLADADQTVLRIDELEAQMNQVLLERAVSTRGPFMPTRIMASNPGTAAEQSEQVVITQAANLFALKQDNEAQQLLVAAIGGAGTQRDHVPTWLVLFDFYRATDQPQLFEALALDFSVRFGRSTPAWVSIPASLPKVTLVTPAATFAQAQSAWVAPAYLDTQAATSLRGRMTQALTQQQPLTIDWRELVDVQPTAWADLKQFFSDMAEQSIRVTLYGLSSFEQTFTNALADAMLTRLALLRCLKQPQAFEALALDYCMAFEVSPPDWRAGLCHVGLESLGLSLGAAPSSASRGSTPASAATWELAGDVAALPRHFNMSALTPQRLVIRCDRWVRCAPELAIELRLWVQSLKAKDLQVILNDVHRVIAAYLLAQGVYEYAKVVVRKD